MQMRNEQTSNKRVMFELTTYTFDGKLTRRFVFHINLGGKKSQMTMLNERFGYVFFSFFSLAMATELRFKRHAGLVFPEESDVAFVLSVEFPGQNLPEEQEISVGMEMELHYLLPTNASELDLEVNPVIEKREARCDSDQNLTNKASFFRAYIYSAVEEALKWKGLSGKKCLLRLICEYSASPILTNGDVFGQILNVLLKPSTTPDERISNTILRAETIGTQALIDDDFSLCQQYYHQCKISILSLFTEWIHKKN